MRKPKATFNLLLVICCLALLVGAVYLPPALAAAGDQALTKAIHLSPSEGALQLANAELAIVDKLGLLENMEYTSHIQLETGRQMDVEAAQAAAREGLTELMRYGALPQPENQQQIQLLDTAATFVLKQDDPAKNMIVWLQSFRLDGWRGMLRLDDETGLVLQCFISGETDLTAGLAEQDWLQAWADYLGIAYLDAITREHASVMDNDRATTYDSAATTAPSEALGLKILEYGLSDKILAATFEQDNRQVNVTVNFSANQLMFGYTDYLFTYGLL